MDPFSPFRHPTLLSTMLLLGFYQDAAIRPSLSPSLAALLSISAPSKRTSCQRGPCHRTSHRDALPPRDFFSFAGKLHEDGGMEILPSKDKGKRVGI